MMTENKLPENPIPAQGRSLGRYRLIEEIGFGGTATVYLAVDDHQQVALKVLHPHLASDPVIKERFRREVEMARALDHPGIVRVHDLAAWENEIALVMEYCPGGNLLGWRAKNTAELFEVTRQILGALTTAHQVGVIHRDLKPQNLLRDGQGNIKLCDFGSARFQNLVGLTTTSMFMGTPQYVPPEILDGYPPDPRTDLFALGAMLYEFITGQPHLDTPLPALISPDMSAEVLGRELEHLALPDWFEALILRLLGPIEQRPSDARSVLQIIDDAHTPPLPGLKTCLYCQHDMPADSPICLTCGKLELIIKRDASPSGKALILKKISEKAAIMEKFTALLLALSGKSHLTLNLILGDARLYSKEERNRLQALPVKILDNLAPDSALKIQKLFTDIEVDTHIHPQDKRIVRRIKSPTLIQPQKGPVSIPAATNMMVEAAPLLSNISTPRVRSLFGEVFLAGFRVAREAAIKDVLPGIEEKFDRLRELISQLLTRIENMDRSLSAVQQGNVYAEIQRLDRKIARTSDTTTLDALMHRRTEQMDLFNKYQKVEREYSRIIARILAVQGKLSQLSRKLAQWTESESKIEAREIAQALIELETDLALTVNGETLDPER
ncbi:protein kinase [candidate division CSSED10-310 bacterium]|uniref:Protein kinase n=1 Tax=candidate division CSSED10-310 bacterium TaxID=2855610 RepID=A0ABV6YYT0_UNCC1